MFLRSLALAVIGAVCAVLVVATPASSHEIVIIKRDHDERYGGWHDRDRWRNHDDGRYRDRDWRRDDWRRDSWRDGYFEGRRDERFDRYFRRDHFRDHDGDGWRHRDRGHWRHKDRPWEYGPSLYIPGVILRF